MPVKNQRCCASWCQHVSYTFYKCYFHKKTFLWYKKAWNIIWSDLWVFVQLWNFWSTLDECIFAHTKVKAWKAPEKASGVPKKGYSPPRFWQTGTSLTGLTARLIGLSGCLLLLQNGLDRQITQADDVLQGDFLRCPWPTHLLHLALNHCWMTSPFWTSSPY